MGRLCDVRWIGESPQLQQTREHGLIRATRTKYQYVLKAAVIIDVSFMYPQMYTSPRLLTEEERFHARKYTFLTIPIWGVAISIIKSSIALTLYCGSSRMYSGGRCPCGPPSRSCPSTFSAMFSLPVLVMHIMSNLGSAINIGTDLLLSLAPIMFLWQLKRPRLLAVKTAFHWSLGIQSSRVRQRSRIHGWTLIVIRVAGLCRSNMFQPKLYEHC